jgi:hypothetical protein
MTVRERIDHTLTLVSGMVIGATIMYAFDEHRGAKRRAMVRDKLVHAGHLLGHAIKKHGRDLLNRAGGQLAELRSTVRDRTGSISDDQLVSRVRAQLGHVLTHAGLLEILAEDGMVTVRGPVLHREVEKIRDRMNKIRGVKRYTLEVDPHETLEHVWGVRGVAQPPRTSRLEAL